MNRRWQQRKRNRLSVRRSVVPSNQTAFTYPQAGCAVAEVVRLAADEEQAGVAKRDQSQTEVRDKLRVLLVEDDPADVELALRALSKGGFETEREAVQTAEEFKQKIGKGNYDVILADYRLPGWCGIETVQMLRREGLDIPVILVSGSLGEVKAVECIKQGAADYVLKGRSAAAAGVGAPCYSREKAAGSQPAGAGRIGPLQPRS